MRKVMNKLYYAFLIASVSVMILSYALAGILEGGGNYAQVASTLATALAATTVTSLLVGLTLVFTKNEISTKVGLGLLLAGFGMAFITVLNSMTGTLPYFAIMSLVAIILFGISFIFKAIAVADKRSNSDDPDEDPTIQKIIKWKKLLDEGILTEQEYQDKREAILGLNKKENNAPKK